jgi:hypothetical protein
VSSDIAEANQAIASGTCRNTFLILFFYFFFLKSKKSKKSKKKVVGRVADVFSYSMMLSQLVSGLEARFDHSNCHDLCCSGSKACPGSTHRPHPLANTLTSKNDDTLATQA